MSTVLHERLIEAYEAIVPALPSTTAERVALAERHGHRGVASEEAITAKLGELYPKAGYCADDIRRALVELVREGEFDVCDGGYASTFIPIAAKPTTVQTMGRSA